MKYLIVIFILLTVSCKDNVVEEVSGVQAGEKVELDKVISTNTSAETETLNTEDIITIVDYEGLKPYLNKDDDKTYIVNFWATWCKPCIKELPEFEKIGRDYASKNVEVLLVSLDFPDKLEKQVLPFIEQNNLESKLVLLDDADANSWIPAIDETWSGAIPATIIYNKNNRTFYERSFTYEELEKEVKSVL